MGTKMTRFGLIAAGCLLVAQPVRATEDVDNGSFAVEQADNAADNVIVPPPSEETLIFTGQDEKPLTPSRNGFREGVDSVVASAKAFSSWMGPDVWIILIAGFGLVGFVLRRSERVLRFEPRREEPPIDRTDRPEHRSAGSGPDASTRPRSDSDPVPSAPQDPVE